LFLSCIPFSYRCQNIADPTIEGDTPKPTDPPGMNDGESYDDDFSEPIERQTATPTKTGIFVFTNTDDAYSNTDISTNSDDSAAFSTINNYHAASIPSAFAALLAAVWMMV
jgi:hypothetical protein